MIIHILNQCYILAATVYDNESELPDILPEALKTIDISDHPKISNEIEQIAEQMDAAVDIWVYWLNGCAKKAIEPNAAMFQKDYQDILEFTIAAGQTISNEPTEMNRDEVFFLIRMILSETQELAGSVCEKMEDSIQMIVEASANVELPPQKMNSTATATLDIQRQVGERIWSQFVYRFANHRLSVKEVFQEVHKANMAKRDPDTGVFLRRSSDGKIIKPQGWMPPNIVEVVERQFEKF